MKDSKIEWTDRTFNIVWGCTEVSPECDHCYARTFARRTGHDVWGPTNPRRFLSPQYYRAPLAWNAAAMREGIRRKVFCSSMADWAENHPVAAARASLRQSDERDYGLSATPSCPTAPGWSPISYGVLRSG